MKWAGLALFMALTTAALSPGTAPSSGSAPPPPRPGEVTVVLLGDVMLGRGIGQAIEANGPAWPFAEVRDLLGADLVFANLESPLVAMPQDASPALNLAAGPEAAQTLVAAGIDVVSLANNHALDAGASGLARTLDELARRNVVAVGAGRTTQEARQPVILSANGVRVAFLAFADVPQATGQPLAGQPTMAALDPDAMEAAVAGAQREADLVVAIFHWGEEYSADPTARQRDMARRAIAAGAQVVAGSHPHVVQPVELPGDAVVAYSLGNFVFDQGHTLRTTRGQALKVRAGRSGIEHVEIVPVSLASGRPVPAGPAATAPNANVVFAPGSDGLAAEPARLFFEKPRPEADLDGDGSPERVEVANGRLRVLARRGGEWQEAWRTPEGWEIDQVALGDVDQEGHPEIVFSLWRTYRGRYGNQPFVFGYRDGEYRPVWRGSAVADPIRELAVGDVDGDGRDELIVLEGDPGEDRFSAGIAVTVWRWSGWGFCLEARSAAGRYRNLRLVDVRGDEHSRGLEILLQTE